MTLEERIRGALWYAVAQYPGAQPLPDEAYTDLARAVVAVLPTADVTDEAITEVLRPVECVPNPYGEGYLALGEDAEQLLPAVRALLDAQAAAHAAREFNCDEKHCGPVIAARGEVEALREQLNAAQMTADEGVEVVGELTSEVEALRAELERLRDKIAGLSGVLESSLDAEREATADRDRAVREALENAAQKIEAEQPWPDGAARIVRSLIPGGTDD